MKKTLLGMSAAAFLLTVNLSADPLKNTLMAAPQENKPIMSLDNMGAAKKPAEQPKSRPDDAVVATINGENVSKEQADKYLALRTQGHLTDFDKLPKDQRQALVNEMSVPLLAAIKAQKELSNEEKSAALSKMWMQKQIMTTQVSDDEAKKAYDTLVKKAKEAAKKAKKEEPKLPSFEEAKREVMLQLAQEKVVKALLTEGKVLLK